VALRSHVINRGKGRAADSRKAEGYEAEMSVLLKGAGFLAACDLGGRLILPGRELPVGVITAALGAPTLVWLIVRGNRA
jgi:ABC-type cobalamin transport system permease subunit